MNAADLPKLRLANQMLCPPSPDSAADIVSGLVAVQAQDYGGAKWSVGLRAANSTDATIARAVADREIIRTWAMRGTLHFVAASDIHWLTALLVPHIIAQNVRRYRQLELDDAMFEQSNATIAKALKDGAQLTRAELCSVLAGEGISADGQRAPYLLQRASLDGVICQGLLQGREPTYVLLSDWVSKASQAKPGDTLEELARRYFTSHGPATQRDFAWWCGLPAKSVQTALDAASPHLTRHEIDGVDFWSGSHDVDACELNASFLPPFDEYLLGYQDRGASLPQEYAKRVNAGGGMPKPTVAVNGEIVGSWRQSTSKAGAGIAVERFRKFTGCETELVYTASQRLAKFLETPIALSI